MTTDYYSVVTRRAQQSKSPAERAERCAADQRRLKQEAAERRKSAGLASKTAASGRARGR
jgi:hypothetical protein